MLAHSNWKNVEGLFATNPASLKILDMTGCENLDTTSMKHIEMKSLGK